MNKSKPQRQCAKYMKLSPGKYQLIKIGCAVAIFISMVWEPELFFYSKVEFLTDWKSKLKSKTFPILPGSIFIGIILAPILGCRIEKAMISRNLLCFGGIPSMLATIFHISQLMRTEENISIFLKIIIYVGNCLFEFIFVVAPPLLILRVFGWLKNSKE